MINTATIKYNSEEKIRKAATEICSILWEAPIKDIEDHIGEYILAFDFSYFYKLNDDNYLIKIIVYGIDQYRIVLEEAVEKKKGFSLFEMDGGTFKDYNLLESSIKSNNLILSSDDISTKIAKEFFKPEEWFNFLREKKFGKGGIVYSKKIAESQAAVYIIFNKSLNLEKTIAAHDFQDSIEKIEKVYSNINKLLIEELVHYSLEFLAEGESDKKFTRRVRDNKHTIGNLDIYYYFQETYKQFKKLHLENLDGEILFNGNEMEDFEKKFDFLYNLFIVYDLAVESSFDKIHNHPLSENTLKEFIEYLAKWTPGFISPIIKFQENIAHPLLNSKIGSELLDDIFLVFFNLFRNASKDRNITPDQKSSYFINVFQQENALIISVKNSGVMKNDWRDFFCKGTPRPDKNKNGLRIVKDGINKLGWDKELIISNEEKTTEIKIIIIGIFNEDIIC